eukprot:snap_masked-scaffold_19-processed-gene-5.30-mRNA-1 protein AED:1.00 eAED:1.00 QI:0/-1/0/0/-1/1/1/0/70
MSQITSGQTYRKLCNGIKLLGELKKKKRSLPSKMGGSLNRAVATICRLQYLIINPLPFANNLTQSSRGDI